jgi:hypothetical protein
MLHKIIIVVLYVSFSIFNCCRDNTIEIKPVKDPRTYTWTVDTLGYPGSFQTLMYDMWGSSPKDVYVVGHNSSNGNGVMWRYDKNEWINVKLLKSEGGYIDGAIELTSIYGFSSTDIYAAGERIIGYNPNPPPTFIDSSLIIHYDGTAWKKVNVYNGSPLRDINGSSASNIIAGGRYNTLYNYNGNIWQKDSINIQVPFGKSFHIESVNLGASVSYLVGYRSFEDMSDLTYYFFERVNSVWTKIDSTSFAKFGEKLFRSPSGTLYSVGQGGVYKYEKLSWLNVFNITSAYIYGIWGTSDNNIFIAGNFGSVYHYNGTDWRRIEELNDPQIDYWAVWTDGTEAFVAGHIFAEGLQKTVIWHGK